ncbi:MAG: TetR/AcrR family transcriptional regulator [Heliobacteriaceae bacterium]|nr:TetR/AcrR family transcriptional regulator [Heliobacteriaceae bacterium]MDD4587030.1 TetR/AcrR family transcriptional regulator [Heliobacteriaceae bacterium]
MTRGTRLDKRKAQTKNKIFEAAVALFLEQGFQATTIEQIVAKADVAKGTFFVHFPTKDAVLFYLGEQRAALTKEILAEKLRGIKSARERIFCLLKALAEFNEEHKLITYLVIRESSSGSDPDKQSELLLRAIFGEIIADGQSQGEFRAGFQRRHAVDMLISTYFYTLGLWLDGKLPKSLVEELAAKVKICLTGIAVPANRQSRLYNLAVLLEDHRLSNLG